MHILTRPYLFLQLWFVRKFHRLEQMQRGRVHPVLVHHPMIRVVHEPGILAHMIKLDRRAVRRDGHPRRRLRRRDDNRGHRLRARVSVSGPAARAHIAMRGIAPRSKEAPQRPLALVSARASTKEGAGTGRRPRLGLVHEHGAASWQIEEGLDVGGEAREDLSVGRGVPHVRGGRREGVVRRMRWTGRGHPHGGGVGRSAGRAGGGWAGWSWLRFWHVCWLIGRVREIGGAVKACEAGTGEVAWCAWFGGEDGWWWDDGIANGRCGWNYWAIIEWWFAYRVGLWHLHPGGR